MKKRWVFGCIILVLVPIVFCGILFAWFRPFEIGYANKPINRKDASTVTEAFAWTLMENRTDIAKTIVHEKQWSRLEQWETEHKAVGCDRWVHIPDEWTSTEMQGVVYGPNDSVLDKAPPFPIGSLTTYYLLLWWPCPGGDYQISVDTKLIWTDNGWQIIDWEDVTERQFQ